MTKHASNATHCFIASRMARKVNRSPSFVGSGPREQLPMVASLEQVFGGAEVAEDERRVERKPLPGILDHRLLATLSFFSLQSTSLERERERERGRSSGDDSAPQPALVRKSTTGENPTQRRSEVRGRTPVGGQCIAQSLEGGPEKTVSHIDILKTATAPLARAAANILARLDRQSFVHREELHRNPEDRGKALYGTWTTAAVQICRPISSCRSVV